MDSYWRLAEVMFGKLIDIAIGTVLIGGTLVALAPVTLWYEAGPEYFSSSVQGEPVGLITDSSVNRDFDGAYEVTLRNVDHNASTLVCSTGRVSWNYEKGSTVPEDVDLNWWVAGKCYDKGVKVDVHNLSEGTYRVSTCHYVKFPLGYSKRNCRKSNVFEITAE